MAKTGTENETTTDDETTPSVGYAHPPTETQFKKGRSGNPNGRPKGSKKLAPLLKKILSEKVSVTEGGKTVRMTKGEALMKMTLNRAIKGDDKAMAAIFALAGRSGRLVDEPEPESGVRLGYLVVPEKCHSTEEWERKHGAAARGERFFHPDGRRKQEPVILPMSLDAAEELTRQGKLSDALECYGRIVRRYKPRPDRPEVDPADWFKAILGMRALSSDFLFAHRYAKALEAIDDAIAQLHLLKAEGIRLDQPFVAADFCACALIFVGRTDEAEAILLAHRGKIVPIGDGQMPWDFAVVHCFAQLREGGLNDPLMDQITEQFMREGSADTETAQPQNGDPDLTEATTLTEPVPTLVDEVQATGSTPLEEVPLPNPFYGPDGKPLYKVTRTVRRNGIPGKTVFTRLPC